MEVTCVRTSCTLVNTRPQTFNNDIRTENSTRPTKKAMNMVTLTAKYAAFGLPAPNSFEILVLPAELTPNGTIQNRTDVVRHIERTDVSNFALARAPDKITIISNVHDSKHTMTAEGKASLRNFGMLCNDSLEKPVQVCLHEGENRM
ncbi:hypothetical protein V8G54_011030 [Vigna mungo]|uniref:Uncharacterized protein n=1 Tax=Vigna mungo TaxID=3915 RepID=A0AAQ3RZ84_VIGMU